MMSLIAVPTVRPLPVCKDIMRVVAMCTPPHKRDGLLVQTVSLFLFSVFIAQTGQRRAHPLNFLVLLGQHIPLIAIGEQIALIFLVVGT